MDKTDELFSHIEKLSAYPKIKALVEQDFGTVRLKQFLDSLMADAYDSKGGNREIGRAHV